MFNYLVLIGYLVNEPVRSVYIHSKKKKNPSQNKNTQKKTKKAIPLLKLRLRVLKTREKDSSGGRAVKNPPAMRGTRIQSLVQEDATCFGATKLPRAAPTEAHTP